MAATVPCRPEIDADWPHRELSRCVEAGGLRWHLQHWGPAQGPALLLLHGTGASTHSFRRLAPLLAVQRPVLAIDLPGHGWSGALPRGRGSMAGMAQATTALLRALDLQPAAVLGHSAGAALMLRMALDGALRPQALLVGVNAALLPFEGVAGWLYAPVARLLAGNSLAPRLAAWRAGDESGVRRLIAATGSRLDNESVALYARLLQRPAHVAGVLAMMANWNLHGLARELPRLRQRLHLLVGEADTTVPPRQAEQVVARVPGSRLHRLPGLGHLAHEEAPDVLAREVEALLQAAPAG